MPTRMRTNRYVTARLAHPGTPAYTLDTALTAFPGSSQTCGAAIQPIRSTPAAAGNAKSTTMAPSQTANQSSERNQERGAVDGWLNERSPGGGGSQDRS